MSEFSGGLNEIARHGMAGHCRTQLTHAQSALPVGWEGGWQSWKKGGGFVIGYLLVNDFFLLKEVLEFFGPIYAFGGFDSPSKSDNNLSSKVHFVAGCLQLHLRTFYHKIEGRGGWIL